MTRTFEVSEMRRGDWAKVRGIFAEGLAGGLAAFMTVPPVWKVWDAGRLPFGRLVARSGENVLGWASLSRVADT